MPIVVGFYLISFRSTTSSSGVRIDECEKLSRARGHIFFCKSILSILNQIWVFNDFFTIVPSHSSPA